MAQPDLRSAAGVALLLLALTSIAHGFMPVVPVWSAAIWAWLAGVLLFASVRRMQRVQISLLLVIGLIGLAWAAARGLEISWTRALVINQAIIAMFAAVSFLRLVSTAGINSTERLPRGRGALWRTLIGTSVFGAIVNLSAFAIMSERMAENGKLSRLQAITMSRAYSCAAFWSPFFVAMAVALTYAPGAELWTLVAVGLPLWVIAMSFAALYMLLDPDSGDYTGYPLHMDALMLPAALAILVLGCNYWLPDISILTTVSFISIAITLLLSAVRHGRQAFPILRAHVTDTLPTMSGELLMFLSAGVFAAGLGAVIQTTQFSVPFTGYGPTQASIVLAVMTALSMMGLHPLINVSVFGGLLLPLAPDANFLGMTFLMSWALGIAVSPVSAIHLALQGRFGIGLFTSVRRNLPFALTMFVVAIIALHVYHRLALN